MSNEEINLKAKELVEKYLNADFNCKGCKTPYCDIPCTSLSLYDAKQCALIAVDEIIKSRPCLPSPIACDSITDCFMQAKEIWTKIKQAIENL
jgi:hypothetical protein